MLALFEMLTVTSPLEKVKFGISATMKNLRSDLSAEKMLFSETPGFILVTSDEDKLKDLAKKHGLDIFEIGETTSDKILKVDDLISADMEELIEVWKKPLEEII